MYVPTRRFVRGWRFWRYFRDYFPIRIVKTAELPPSNESYLVGIHPHGILCFGAFCCMATDATDFSQLYPGLSTTLITLPEQFWLPGSRELVAAAGLCSSSKSSMELLLRESVQQYSTVCSSMEFAPLNFPPIAKRG